MSKDVTAAVGYDAILRQVLFPLWFFEISSLAKDLLHKLYTCITTFY